MANHDTLSNVEFAHFTSLQLGPQKPNPPKTSFLFVVKTPESDLLSRSTSRSAAASINSHAQRWAQETAQSNSRQPSGSSVSPSNPGQLSFDKCVTRCRVDRLLVSDSKQPNSKRAGARKARGRPKFHISIDTQSGQPATALGKFWTTTSDESESKSTIIDRTQAHQINSKRPTSLPRSSFPTSTSLNAFIPSSLPRDDNVHSVLQYYLSFVLLSMPENASVTASKNIAQHSSIIRAIVQGCMQQEVHMYALLAATASRMRLVSGIRFNAENGPESYLDKAIQSLRALLNTDLTIKDRQFILDIYYLSVCEWYLGNYEAANTHFKFVKTFWKSLNPSLSTIDNYLHDMLSYIDGFLTPADVSASLASSPLPVDPVNYGTPPMHLAGTTYDSTGTSDCSSLRSALEYVAYSQDLKLIVRDLPSMPETYTHVCIHLDKTNLLVPETSWLQSKCNKLIYRLLAPPSYGNELCCRLSLALILGHMSMVLNTKIDSIATASSPTQSSESVLRVQRLRRQLQYEILLPSNEINPSTFIQSTSQLSSYSITNLSSNSHRPIWTGKSDEFLLWILMTGFFAAKQNELQDESWWFEKRVKAMLTGLGIEDNVQLSRLMDSFFTIPEMLVHDFFKTDTKEDKNADK